MNKRKKDVPDFPAIPFDEALGRLLQTDPKEIADAFEQNKARSDEIRQRAEERKEFIKRAGRPSGKRFRL